MLRAAVIPASFALLVMLGGCTPRYVPPAELDRAELDVEVDSHGGARAVLVLGGRDGSRHDAIEVGRAVLPMVLGAEVDVESVTSGGWEVAAAEADGFYEPGPRPRLDVDLTAALGALESFGYTEVRVDLWLPLVPAAGTWNRPADHHRKARWIWDAATSDTAPVGTIVLEPKPARGWAQVALTMGAAATLGAAIVVVASRRRVLGGVLAGLAMVGSVSVGVTERAAIGVAGHLTGPVLQLVELSVVVQVLVVLLAVPVILAAVLVRGRPTVTRPRVPPY